MKVTRIHQIVLIHECDENNIGKATLIECGKVFKGICSKCYQDVIISKIALKKLLS